jgi:hypothetical protein
MTNTPHPVPCGGRRPANNDKSPSAGAGIDTAVKGDEPALFLRDANTAARNEGQRP